MNISMTKTTHPGKLPPADRLGFGSVFTDHMFLMDYTDREGWHNARIVPFGLISISPAASVLHYGTEVFEGLKAYRRPDGAVQLFSLLPVPRSISARFCILRILRLPCTVCMRRRLQSFCLRREAISQTV